MWNGIKIIQKVFKLRRSTFKPCPRNKEWLVDDWRFTDAALSCSTEQIIKVSYIALCSALFCLSWKVKTSLSSVWSHFELIFLSKEHFLECIISCSWGAVHKRCPQNRKNWRFPRCPKSVLTASNPCSHGHNSELTKCRNGHGNANFIAGLSSHQKHVLRPWA